MFAIGNGDEVGGRHGPAGRAVAADTGATARAPAFVEGPAGRQGSRPLTGIDQPVGSIDRAGNLIAPLHTHDGSGVVHIESATDVPFTLGQVFAEWGQPLRPDRVGPITLASGRALRVFRNGQPVAGDPATLRLVAHDEIVVWVDPTDRQPQVPSSYTFPAGE